MECHVVMVVTTAPSHWTQQSIRKYPPSQASLPYVGVMVDSSGARGAKGDLSLAKLLAGLVLDRPAGGAGRKGSQIIGLF